MSSMLQAPPASISIGGGPGGPPGGGAMGQGDPDSADVVSKLRQALQLVQDAAQQEKDDIDAASITKIASMIHAAIAAEQKLSDDVMGGGPGVKMIRKTQGA